MNSLWALTACAAQRLPAICAQVASYLASDGLEPLCGIQAGGGFER